MRNGKERKIKLEGKSNKEKGRKSRREIKKEKIESEYASFALTFKPESHIACSKYLLKFFGHETFSGIFLHKLS